MIRDHEALLISKPMSVSCCFAVSAGGQLNQLHNVATVNIAVIDGARTVAIENLEGWQANRIIDCDTKDSLPVAGLSLDQLVEQESVKRIDFLKMNIEGAEAMAIRRMDQTLRITRSLCISCHDFRADDGEGEFFRTKRLIQSFLERAGLRIVSRESDGRPSITHQVNAPFGNNQSSIENG